MPHRVLIRRVGLRGEIMVLLGVVWCLIGLGIATGVSNPTHPSLWHVLLPAPVRTALWIIPGLWAIISARIGGSNLGLGLLMIAPAIHGTSFLWAWTVHVIPGSPPGLPGGWYNAVFYGLMIAYVIHAAHIPADDLPPLRRGGRP